MATRPIKQKGGLTYSRVRYTLHGDYEQVVPQSLPELNISFLEIRKCGEGGVFLRVKTGFSWDGASWCPDYGLRGASCAHDALLAAIRKGFLPTYCVWAANDIFYTIAKRGKTPKAVAWVAWKATILFCKWALRHPHPTRGE